MLDSVRNSRLKVALEDSSVFFNDDRGWKPPIPSHFRLDVDAGYDLQLNRFSVAAVIRDSQGLVCIAKSISIRNPGSVIAAELLALRYGMEMCLVFGISNVCIFSDSSEAIRIAINPVEELGTNGVLALDVYTLFQESNFVFIKHMFRSANHVAHFLARRTLLSSSNL